MKIILTPFGILKVFINGELIDISVKKVQPYKFEDILISNRYLIKFDDEFKIGDVCKIQFTSVDEYDLNIDKDDYQIYMDYEFYYNEFDSMAYFSICCDTSEEGNEIKYKTSKFNNDTKEFTISINSDEVYYQMEDGIGIAWKSTDDQSLENVRKILTHMNFASVPWKMNF